MIKRALFFSTPYCLSLKNSQMIINTREMPEMKRSVPIEDIGCVVLEHQQTSITLPLLNALSDNNVAVILCGENRMPNAMLMNLDSNSTQGESYRAQIEASEPLKRGCGVRSSRPRSAIRRRCWSRSAARATSSNHTG